MFKYILAFFSLFFDAMTKKLKNRQNIKEEEQKVFDSYYLNDKTWTW